jgi:hypothetical protein
MLTTSGCVADERLVVIRELGQAAEFAARGGRAIPGRG